MDKTFELIKQITGGKNSFNKRINQKTLDDICAHFLADGGQIFGIDGNLSFSAERIVDGNQEFFAVVSIGRSSVLTFTSFRFVKSRRQPEEILTY